MAYRTIISPNIRVRYPEHFQIGEGSVVDDYSYFSTRVRVGRFSHIAAGCTVGGGGEFTFTLGDYSSISSGARIWCASDNFVENLIMIIHTEFLEAVEKPHMHMGDVTFERLTGVGANTVVMPNNHIPEGAAIGALSFVPPNYPFEPWTVYAGTPIRPVKARNKESVLAQIAHFEAAYQAWAASQTTSAQGQEGA